MENFTTNLVLALSRIGDLMLEWLNQHAVNIVAILIGAWFIRRFGTEIISQFLKRTIRSDLYPSAADREKRLKTLESLVGASTRVTVYIVATILIIGEINPHYTTALFASAGLIGVAFGIGGQSVIRDFVNGLFVIMENQYRVGDIITAAGVSGTVEGITIRTTTLRDLDGHVHHVPNGVIQVATNKTSGYTRINEDIVVDGGTDLDRLEHVINHVGQELAAVAEYSSKVTEAPSFARVVRFDGDNVVVKILGKTTPGSHLEIKSELYKRLQKALRANHIKLAGMAPAETPKK